MRGYHLWNPSQGSYKLTSIPTFWAWPLCGSVQFGYNPPSLILSANSLPRLSKWFPVTLPLVPHAPAPSFSMYHRPLASTKLWALLLPNNLKTITVHRTLSHLLSLWLEVPDCSEVLSDIRDLPYIPGPLCLFAATARPAPPRAPHRMCSSSSALSCGQAADVTLSDVWTVNTRPFSKVSTPLLCCIRSRPYARLTPPLNALLR